MPWPWRIGAWATAPGTNGTGVQRANPPRCRGGAVGPVGPGLGRSCARRARRSGRGRTADPSQPTPVRRATAAMRAGFSRHTGLRAAECLRQRQPGATVGGCAGAA
jgi:hypothetical protein